MEQNLQGLYIDMVILIVWKQTFQFSEFAAVRNVNFSISKISAR